MGAVNTAPRVGPGLAPKTKRFLGGRPADATDRRMSHDGIGGGVGKPSRGNQRLQRRPAVAATSSAVEPEAPSGSTMSRSSRGS